MAESSVNSVFATLHDLQNQLHEAEDDLGDHDIVAISNIITVLQMQLDQLRRAKRTRHASADEMADFIISEILHPKEEKNPVKQNLLLPGGVEAHVRARAQGKCELCGTEFRLGVHHIIARAAGGLDHEDNLALLCRTCHNAVENDGYTSRASLLRGKSVANAVDPETTKARSEKAAETRARNLSEQARADAELATWDIWAGMTSATVPVFALEDAVKIRRPEKPWHVIVYGAGRHAQIAQE
jgi:5-methylcytosine-specific restriction endonuclease McrA